jgi:hypothetical protein
MKKIKLILFSLVAILFVACTDDTNQYSNQLFTDSELNRAFRQCLTQSADSANAHLSIPNSEELGFYNYSEGIYKIGLPKGALFIADTLEIHGLGYLVDTLIRKTNHAAELCGNGLKIYFTETVSSISFQDPYRILNGDSTAITTYFEKNYFDNFNNRTQTLLSINFAVHGINDEWQNILNIYFMLTGQIVSVDYLGNASQTMSKGFLKEMKLEEAKIRKDVARRGATTSKLYEVFATLD